MLTKTFIAPHNKEKKYMKINCELFLSDFCIIISFVFLFFRQIFFQNMAYTSTSPTKRTTSAGSSRTNFQHQQPTYSQQQQPSYSQAQEHHIYEEQPYYSNEPNISGQSIGGENRRTGGVCHIFFFFPKLEFLNQLINKSRILFLSF
jgi:hypothetical protein